MEWLDEFPTMERQGLRDLKKAIDLGFRDFSRAYGDGIEGFFEPLLYFLVWLDKLLPLPGFLVRRANDWPDWAELAQGLALSGYFIERELVPNGADALRETRVRLASAVAAMG